MMDIFHEFTKIADYLDGSFIVRYSEFDAQDHCYYTLQNCLPFINRKSSYNLSVNLRDGMNGKLVHVIHQERDFEQGVIEITPPYKKITLLYRSGYKYVIYLKIFE